MIAIHVLIRYLRIEIHGGRNPRRGEKNVPAHPFQHVVDFPLTRIGRFPHRLATAALILPVEIEKDIFDFHGIHFAYKYPKGKSHLEKKNVNNAGLSR